MPYRYLSGDVAATAAAFFAGKEVGALAAVAGTLVGAVFEGVPESTAAAPPKAKARSSLLCSCHLVGLCDSVGISLVASNRTGLS